MACQQGRPLRQQKRTGFWPLFPAARGQGWIHDSGRNTRYAVQQSSGRPYRRQCAHPDQPVSTPTPAVLLPVMGQAAHHSGRSSGCSAATPLYNGDRSAKALALLASFAGYTLLPPGSALSDVTERRKVTCLGKL